jgi:hypothetical protein
LNGNKCGGCDQSLQKLWEIEVLLSANQAKEGLFATIKSRQSNRVLARDEASPVSTSYKIGSIFTLSLYFIFELLRFSLKN